MRLLHNFFAVSSEILMDMLNTFNIEQEAVFTHEIGDDAERGRRDRDPPRPQTIFYETPKINYNLYTNSPRKQSIEHIVMSQIKGKKDRSSTHISRKKCSNKAGRFRCFNKL